MADPVITRLPDTQKAVVNKYQRLGPILNQIDPQARNALLRFDIQRAMRGQQPLSERQTASSLSTILSGQATTPAPHRSLGERALDDFRNLTTSIPRIPSALYKEATALPQALPEISKALAKGDVEALAKAPGIRMLPGSFVAGQVAKGGPGALLEHPLFSALDILPFVGKGAKALPAVREATRLAEEAGTAIPRPLFAAATRTLDETGAVVPNRLGRGVQSLGQTLGRTPPGQVYLQAFGRESREMARMAAQESTKLRENLEPGGRASIDPLTNLARESNNLRQVYPDIPEARRIELTLMMQENPQGLHSLGVDEIGDTERAFAGDVRDLANRYAEVGTQQGFLEALGGETYDLASAEKIRSARSAATRFGHFVNVRRAIEAGNADPTALLDLAHNIGRRTDIGKNSKANLIEGIAHAADSAGFDNSHLLTWVKQFRKGKLDAGRIGEDISAGRLRMDARPSVPTEQIISSLNAAAKTDFTIARLLDHIKAGRFTEARRLAKTLSGRKKFVVEGIDEYLDTLDRSAKRQRWLAKNSQFTDKRLAKLTKQADDIHAQTPPARFTPLLSRVANEKLLARLVTDADEAQVEAITQAVMERRYSDIPGFNEKEFSRIKREVNNSWQQLKAEGIDPIFVHRVTPGRASSMGYPRVLESIRTPTQVKARTGDITPYIQDATVALSHQGLEWLSRRGSEEFVANVLERWGRTEDSLLDQYLPAARVRAGIDPTLDVRAHAVELMKREYSRYDPAKIITWPAPRLTGIGENTWLPKYLAENLQRMHNPKTHQLTSLVDPVMGAFRTSLLPLSPRWHFYNILGGGLMTVLRTDPTVFTKIGAARRMLKEGLVPEELRAVMASNEGRLQAELAYRAGVTSRRLVEEAASSRNMGGIAQGISKTAEATAPVRNAFSKVIEKSYHVNSLFDDTYRAMAYLYGYDKSITKGLTREASQRAGISLTRKIMQNWDEITPIERSVMRYVFPFYGFMQHIMRYTLSYPFDHPVRTAIMGSFARNEVEDMGTGLPDRFLNSFFLGEPDKDGNVRAVNLAGMNPFSDVSNYFTLAGFMGNLNPVASTVLEHLGLDPLTGGPELYPNLRYDPESGRLAAHSPGFFSSLIQNTIPQSRVLAGMAGRSSEFKELLRTNPEAAYRMIRSQAGLPIIFRDVNVPTELTKAELARDEAMQTSFREALSSGQHTQAAKAYPTLGALLGQVRTLQSSGALANYTPVPPAAFPGGQAPGLLEMAQNALINNNVP